MKLPSFTGRVGNVNRLDRNEWTTSFPEGHFRQIMDSITPEDISAYPEFEPIYEKLASWLNVERSQLLLTYGADTAIRSVYEVYVNERDQVIFLTPTYAMFAVYCDMFGADKKEISYDDDFSSPSQKIVDAINPNTKLIAIANPNHTGTAIPESELLSIIKAAQENGTLVLVDETYYHFYNGTLLPHINEFDNLIIVRTFSKAFGIAGLRVGYIISDNNIISQLYKVKLTYEITSISAKFLDYLLDHMDIMEEIVGEVNAGKKYLTEEFEGLGIYVPPTCTNFVLAKMPSEINGEDLVISLKINGFAVKGPYSSGVLEGYIRITAGPVEQMQRFMDAFKSVFK